MLPRSCRHRRSQEITRYDGFLHRFMLMKPMRWMRKLLTPNASCSADVGDRDGRECQAAVAERARSSDPRGAAAAAGERPRREAEEEPTASDGPWLRLT